MSQLLAYCLEPHLAQLLSLCTSFSTSKLPCSPSCLHLRLQTTPLPSLPQNTPPLLPVTPTTGPKSAYPLELSFLWDASLIHPHEVGTLVCAPVVPELSFLSLTMFHRDHLSDAHLPCQYISPYVICQVIFLVPSMSLAHGRSLEHCVNKHSTEVGGHEQAALPRAHGLILGPHCSPEGTC